MKKYKIGEVGKEFGVSIDALRFYEKKGFLKPQKDKDNGFRFYTYEDFGVFLAIRSFRQMGFHVKEIGAVFNGLEFDDIINKCSDKITEKNEAIKQLEIETKQINEFINLLKEYKKEDKQWMIKPAGTYFFLKHVHLNDGTLCVNPLLKKWLNFLPTVSPALCIPLEEYKIKNIDNSYWVMAISEVKMKECQLPIDESVIQVNMGECLHYLFEKDVNEPLSALILDEPLYIMQSQGYALNGDILCRYVCETKSEKRTVDHYIIMIPIIKIKREVIHTEA
ncbi:MerR family transcriptional regulator [Bacillus wiedmannii]|uniref:MerR family transcriptional regulator n=1 Tax=Bacillus cereus group TaxID=86661 RepID=UPI0018F6E0C4|nr:MULTISPECIES: MerR family transcriptional regulator [Bacillus cereus group]MBJ8080798.1 MerR family transcriptional regulator [Bacillus cereus group sp. N14]MDI6676499.1 MerR family transcriptional regulator [Bacillus wiedmannii]